MQIHVVSQGESLWQIANRYGRTVQEIVESNGIENQSQLVVGQALVIPMTERYHRVGPGESLYQISHLYRISVQELAQVNRLPYPYLLYPGMLLYIPPRPKMTVDVSAYANLEIGEQKSTEAVQKIGQYLTYVTVFNYRFDENGNLSSLNDNAVVQAAYSKNVVPLMVVTNISEGGFSNELITKLLQSDSLQETFINNIIEKAKEKGYLGVDLDFEYVGAENREAYISFLQKLRTRLDENNYFMSTALPPKISATQKGILYEGQDYRAIGEMNDFVFLMTYEWGWTGGPPMAVAPVKEVEKVVTYALTEIPANKLMMGIPLYGYDWTLPYEQGVTRARAISSQQAIQLAIRYNAQINFDENAKAPNFQYTDEKGRIHEVWFEDARSIQAKFDLVKKYQLRGFFYWVLGFDLPQNWLLIEGNFHVRKRI